MPQTWQDFPHFSAPLDTTAQIPSSTQTLKHLNVFLRCQNFFPAFYCLLPTSTHIHSPDSLQTFSVSPSPLSPPTSLHYSCSLKINRGSNTQPSPLLCSFSLLIPNPSLSIQLFFSPEDLFRVGSLHLYETSCKHVHS